MLTQNVGPVTIGHGQGKRAVTLLTEGGCYYPIVSHYSYKDRQIRSQSAPQNAGRIRGLRPMHQTTMAVTKPPWNPREGYLTSAKKMFDAEFCTAPNGDTIPVGSELDMFEKCEKCTCSASTSGPTVVSMGCCGYGINAGVMVPPDGCKIITGDDGCSVKIVTIADETQSCMSL